MFSSQTQFRFYWMHEKFLEVPEVATIGKNNPVCILMPLYLFLLRNFAWNAFMVLLEFVFTSIPIEQVSSLHKCPIWQVALYIQVGKRSA